MDSAHLSALEKFLLLILMLERDQGDEVRFDMDEFRAKAEELDGWSAVVLIRPDSVAFRVVSPERRRELIEQGWYAY